MRYLANLVPELHREQRTVKSADRSSYNFLYSLLKAGPAGGRLQRPSSAGNAMTGTPPHPRYQAKLSSRQQAGWPHLGRASSDGSGQA
jgi:hypothetical protein